MFRLYRREDVEENVFWDSYCEIEKARLTKYKDSIRERKDTNTIYSELKKKLNLSLSTSNSDKPEGPHLVFKRTLSPNSAQRLRPKSNLLTTWWSHFTEMLHDAHMIDNFFGVKDVQQAYLAERDFRLFFVKKTKFVSLCALTISLFILFLSIMQTISNVYNNSNYFEKYKMQVLSLMSFVVVWLVFDVICIIHIVVISNLRSTSDETIKDIWYGYWINAGHGIITAKFLMGVMRFVVSLATATTCYGLELGATLSVIAVPEFYLISIVLDIFQVIVLSTVPFPWLVIIFMNVLQFVEELLRIYSCKDRLFGGNLYIRTINAVVFSVAVSQFIIAVLSSYSFNRCMRSSFHSIDEQDIAAQEKIILVNMLCRDIKAPMQQMSEIFQSMDSVLSNSPINIEHYTESLQEIAVVVNQIVDDVLFLVRVDEGRFVFRCNTSIDLASMLTDVIEAVMVASMNPADIITSPSIKINSNSLSEKFRHRNNNSSLKDSNLIHFNSSSSSRESVADPHEPRPTKILFRDLLDIELLDDVTTIVTDCYCLRVLLYHALLITCELVQETICKLEDRICVRVERDCSNKQVSQLGTTAPNSPFWCKVSIALKTMSFAHPSMGFDRDKTNGIRRQGLLEQLSVISQRVVNTYNGQWMLYNNCIEFTMLCDDGNETDKEHSSFTSKQSIAESDRSIIIAKDVEFPRALLSEELSPRSGHLSPRSNQLSPRPVQPSPRLTPQSSVKFSIMKKALSLQLPERGHSEDVDQVLSQHAETDKPFLLSAPSPRLSARQSSSILSAREYAIAMDEIEEQLSQFIPTAVYVYATDASMIGLLKNVVGMLPGGNEVVVDSQINLAQLKLAAIIFVQSIDACRKIRHYGFHGKLVVLSERLSYFDDLERQNFDYGVSLPCSERELHSFIRWLFVRLLRDEVASSSQFSLAPNQKNKPRKMSRNRQLYLENMDQRSSRLLLKQKIRVIRRDQESCLPIEPCIIKRWMNFAIVMQQFSQMRWLLTNVFQLAIPFHQFESYGRWKILNPGDSWWHYTSFTEVAALSVVLNMVYSYTIGAATLLFAGVATCYFCTVLWRKSIFRFLQRQGFQINFTNWWWGLTVFDALFTAVTALNQIFIAHELSTVYISDTHSIDEFMNAKIRLYSGSDLVFFVVSFPAWAKLAADYVPWPFCLYGSLILLFRGLLIIRAMTSFLKLILSRFFYLILVMLMLVLILIQFNNELAYRQEFIALFDLIESKDFLEKCLQTSRRSLLLPLRCVDKHYSSFITEVVQRCKDDTLFIGEQFKRKLEQLKVYRLVVKELSYSLQIADGNIFSTPNAATSIYESMKEVYLFDTVRRICSSLLFSFGKDGKLIDTDGLTCTIDDLSLKIFLHVHPSLMLVRVDAELLTAIVCNGCRMAIERMFGNEQCFGNGESSQLLIWIAPCEEITKESTTEINALQINMLDTGSIPAAIPMVQLQPEDLLPLFLLQNGIDRLYQNQVDHSSSFIPLRKARSRKSNNLGTKTSHFPQNDNFKNSSPHYSTGQAICDRFMKFFHIPLRFQAGRVRHTHYKSFQTFVVPYIHTRDCLRFEKWFSSEKQSLAVVDHHHELQVFYRYIAAYGDFQQKLRRQEAKAFQRDVIMSKIRSWSSASQALALPSFQQVKSRSASSSPMAQSKKRRCIGGSIVCYGRFGGELSLAVANSKSAFQSLGWRFHFCVLRDLPDDRSIFFADCIIVENDFSLLAWSYDAQDLIVYLRSKGFQGLLIVAVNRAAMILANSTSTLTSHDFIPKFPRNTRFMASAEASTQYAFQRVVDAPDLFVALPFSLNEIHLILDALHERLLSRFIDA
jgi:hypothetical protein